MRKTNQNRSRKSGPIAGMKPHVDVNTRLKSISTKYNPPASVKLTPILDADSFGLKFIISRERSMKSIRIIGKVINIKTRGI